MELTTYDTYGRPKSSVQSILGSIVAEAKMPSGATSVTTGTDVLSITIEGDGVTPLVAEWVAIVSNNTATTPNNYVELRDGSGGGGTRYGSAYVSGQGANTNMNLSGQSEVIPAFTGTKTFYLRAAASTGTMNFMGTASGVNNFMRIRRAHVHTLQKDPNYAGVYAASMYLANSGAPTHTNNAGWQKVGGGGGTGTWVSEFDTRPAGVDAQVDVSTNKRIDIRKTGLYRVGWSVAFTAISDAKGIDATLYKNGARYASVNATTGVVWGLVGRGSILASLTNGDYLELYAYQNDSASEAYDVSYSTMNHLQIEYLGPA